MFLRARQQFVQTKLGHADAACPIEAARRFQRRAVLGSQRREATIPVIFKGNRNAIMPLICNG